MQCKLSWVSISIFQSVGKKLRLLSSKEKHMKKTLLILGFAASTSMAMAAFTPVTNAVINTVVGSPDQYWLQSIMAGGNTYGTNGLATGTTTTLPTTPASTPLMDNFNLNDLASGFGAGNLPIRTVLFGGVNWTDSNGSLLDFFLFEASGSANPDDITIAAIFTDDSLGANVVCPTIVDPAGWGNTGLTIGVGAPQAGQAITGLAWSITDLKDALGNNLTTLSVIKGIAITAGNGIDPTSFSAVVAPVPEPSTMALALLGLGGLAVFRKRF
jgi:hypothetical protein